MKKLTLLLSASALAAVLAIPAGASADVETARASGADCDYARAEGEEPANPPPGGDDPSGSVAGGNVEVVDNDAGDPQNVVTSNEQVIVYANVNPTDDAADNGGAGVSDDADAAAGACMNLNGTGGTGFDGGTLEAGAGNPLNMPDSLEGPPGNLGPLPGQGGPVGGYVIADGDNDNTPGGFTDGYIGVSNFETGDKDATGCEATDPNPELGTGTNSGDCLTIRSGPNTGGQGTIGAYPVPLLACGDDSSSPAGTWEGSSRDGCTLPE